jgi:hypothetical protein
MTNPTSNFNWQMPTSTDLVTDLPADFEVFGQAVDTSMADLKGGTTGQILSKATNTDMDFTWITNDVGDITAVTVTSPITGGGTSGSVGIAIQDALTTQKGAVQLSDSTSTTSSILAATPTAVKSAYDLAVSATGLASVNLLLNSNFALNQRVYVSAANLVSGAYGFDRWKSNYTNTTLTFTASTQGQSLTISASGGLQQIIEQGLVPAGTYTLSWTGTATGRVYNSGGTPPSYAASPVTFTADGTANVVVEFTASGATKTLSKVQFNAGTGVTWTLATPTLQSELAACQRYYFRTGGSAAYERLTTMGTGASSTTITATLAPPVPMRIPPSAVEFSTLTFWDGTGGLGAVTALTIATAGKNMTEFTVTASGGGITTYRPYFVIANGSTNAYLALSAEI